MCLLRPVQVAPGRSSRAVQGPERTRCLQALAGLSREPRRPASSAGRTHLLLGYLESTWAPLLLRGRQPEEVSLVSLCNLTESAGSLREATPGRKKALEHGSVLVPATLEREGSAESQSGSASAHSPRPKR